jgi:RND family efflux transporter MFP subunit
MTNPVSILSGLAGAWLCCALSAALLSACSGDPALEVPHEHDGAHDHHAAHRGAEAAAPEDDGADELSPIAITVWTETSELFAEHPPAVEGQELSFLAHLTVLDGFTALEDASVTLQLSGPGQAEGRADVMLRPGIFRPTLTAPRAGTYQGTLVVRGPEHQDTISGFQVVVHSTAADALRAQQARAAAEPTSGVEPIVFLKEQQWVVPFATAFAEEQDITPTLGVTGEVTAPHDGDAAVGAPLSGRLIPPRGGLPLPGQAVTRGQLLATIAPSPASPEDATAANRRVLEAEVAVEAAQAAVARTAELLADRAVPERDASEARRNLRIAEESLRAARLNRQLFTTATRGQGAGLYRVVAPISGVVVDVQASVGGAVSSGDPLFRIVDFSELWLEARVPEHQAGSLRADVDASFAVAGATDWQALRVTGDDPPASVVSIGRVVDPQRRTVTVVYALRSPSELLRVGAMIRVFVPTGSPWRGVAVPREALVDDDGRMVVYVQPEGEAFEERVVELGPSTGPLVGILSGVRAGERVVVRGATLVRLSALAGSAPSHGHVH